MEKEFLLEIQWLDLTSGEILDGETIIGLIEYENDMFTGSVFEGDDLWFTSECDTEDEVLEQIELHLEEGHD